jgi:hypothetical protein
MSLPPSASSPLSRPFSLLGKRRHGFAFQGGTADYHAGAFQDAAATEKAAAKQPASDCAFKEPASKEPAAFDYAEGDDGGATKERATEERATEECATKETSSDPASKEPTAATETFSHPASKEPAQKLGGPTTYQDAAVTKTAAPTEMSYSNDLEQENSPPNTPVKAKAKARRVTLSPSTRPRVGTPTVELQTTSPVFLSPAFDYAEVSISLSGERIARDIVKPHCRTMVVSLKENRYYLNPTSPYALQVKSKKVTQNQTVYAAYDPITLILDKAGQTANFAGRTGYYQEQAESAGTIPPIFRIVVDVDNIREDANVVLEAEYKQVMASLGSDERLAPFQRFYFGELLTKREGDRLGPKASIMMALIEMGTQLDAKVGCPAEFLMYDSKVEALIYKWTQICSKPLLERLHVLRAAIARGGKDKKAWRHGVRSWKPGHDAVYATTVTTTQCVLGTDDDDAMTDTIPVAAIPNAKTDEEVFNTSAYTDAIKLEGLDVLPRILEMFRCYDYGFVDLDSNKLIYDEFLGQQVEQVLVQFGFRFDFYSHGTEIKLFIDTTNEARVIFLHYPYCVVNYGRWMTVFRRQIKVCIMTDVVRVLDGKPHLSPLDKFHNPVNGMLGYQITKRAIHQNNYVASAIYRDCTTCPMSFCLVENGLGKNANQDVPVTETLRNRYYGHNLDDHGRPTDCAIYCKAKSIICDQSLESTQAMVTKLKALLNAGAKKQDRKDALKHIHWKTLIEDFVVPHTPLAELLQKAWDKDKPNSGNPNARGRFKDERVALANVWDSLWETHQPNGNVDGPAFWVRQKDNSVLPPTGAMSQCGTQVFPGTYEVGRIVWYLPSLREMESKKSSVAHLTISTVLRTREKRSKSPATGSCVWQSGQSGQSVHPSRNSPKKRRHMRQRRERRQMRHLRHMRQRWHRRRMRRMLRRRQQRRQRQQMHQMHQMHQRQQRRQRQRQRQRRERRQSLSS